MSTSEERTLFYLENSRAFRCAWVLEELSLPYTLRTYARIDGKRAEPALKADSGNPLGKSPYLVDSGIRVPESTAIVRYLVERYGPQRGRLDLLGAAENWQERADVDAWVSFSEGMMVHSLAAVYPRWFADAATARGIEAKMAANVHNNLDRLEAALSGQYLVGGRLTIADIMCAFSAEYTLGMDVAVSSEGKTRDNWPKTVAWLKRLASLPSYQQALARGATHRFAITE
ncbi:related to GTT1-glutathione S-transferase [Sporisorium reilianum SRZ2]|uniref:Related to GTT1-glutathione S-transferase n=1 Tax=Sporisorium reilianum (strain SRZ2) TaxID=999809 RepID=E7A1W8_SPORE|nr:related to GTT1-glutathione S-transferase [Sporisorium reilianum SRZ2]